MKEQPLLESMVKFENKQVDAVFTNEEDNKEEKYKLFDEEKESLLIKEALLPGKSDCYEVKISELFQGENNEVYYINKEKSKEKYLNNCFETDKKGEDISFNNKDKNEMDALYREVCLMHPRKLINGEIQKYSFKSWTGFFLCQKYPKLEKNEFYPLGFGISSYFKTIKLFIFFFLIISLINLVAVYQYSRHKSVINDSNIFFKTTLGNTKITTYNSYIYHFTNQYPSIPLDCQNKTIGKIVYAIKIKTPQGINEIINQTELTFNETDRKKYNYLTDDHMNYYNKKRMENCNINSTKCNLIIDKDIDQFLDDNDYNYLFYECIDTSLLPPNSEPNYLRTITKGTAVFTSLILIILYYYYRGAIDIDTKTYHKDKVVINNYTLVLRGLKKNSNDYYQELNDLISHLNNVISKEMVISEDNTNDGLKDFQDKIKNKNLYIFDISISTVNEKKIEIINKIKSLKDDITNIKEGHDTLDKKIKHKIDNAIGAVTSLYNQIKNKNKEEEEDNENTETLVTKDSNELTERNEKRIEKSKEKIKKQMTRISKNQIQGLHMEGDKKRYVDIYITFRNPKISNFIYISYNKNFFQRLLLFLLCRCRKISIYYYKRQWLNFDMSNNAPTNIKWENSYISTKKKLCRRFFTYFIFVFTIAISTLLISYFANRKDEAKSKINSYIITGVLKVISITSSTILEKLTKCEKYSTLSKSLTSDIEKYFLLNFAVATISVNIGNYYTYKNFDSQYSIIMSSILQSMMLSIITEHLSILAKFLFRLFKRFLDSDFENGKKTKIKKRLEYEELYVGPEFPIGERLSSIFVNLGLCLIYGTSCPLIYLFFTLYLLTTFIVDKILIIHYYKKPPYYDNYFSILTQKILFLSIVAHLYCTIYYMSNPYLFNYFQDDNINYGNSILYYILNPIALIFSFISILDPISITIFNFSDVAYLIVIILLLFILSIIFVKLNEKMCKKEEKLSLLNSPNIDVGLIYSTDELNKYYEIKKLELFKFILNHNKDFKKYINLANNYKNVIDYLKQNIELKKSSNLPKEVANNNEENNIITTNIIENNTVDSNELIVKEKNDRLLIGDPSYNLAFISNYEMYEYFDLLYYV